MDTTVTKTNPLGTERIGKLVLTFAVPSIISMVVNALYNIVDQIFIGQGVGYLGNGATNVVMPMTSDCHSFKSADRRWSCGILKSEARRG